MHVLERTLTPADIEALVEQLAPEIANHLAGLPKLVTVAEFARLTSLSVPTLNRMIRDKQIEVKQPAGKGGRVLIDYAAAIKAMK